MFRIDLRSFAAAAIIVTTLGSCGGATKTVTQTAPKTKAQTVTKGARTTTAASQTQPTSTTKTSDAASQNNQVISQASQASDNQAQLGATAIRRILTQKLGLNNQEEFNLNHHAAPGSTGNDCYVKLGAEAVNFEYMSRNILRSPNGKDVVFVQSNTVTPLVRCLVAVKSAIGW